MEHLSERLKQYGVKVYSTDLIDRGYGDGQIDFLAINSKWTGDILTNPPYKYASEFIEKALDIIPDGNRIFMLVKVQFLEGKSRRKLFEKFPPKTLYIFTSRLLCAKNADFDGMRKSGGSAVAYMWAEWVKGYQGDPSVKWIN